MAKVWKVLALLVVITALVWLTTLWRWQSGHVDPSASQLLIHLMLLPVVLTFALVAMVWGVKRLRSYAAAPVVVATPKANAQATATAPSPAAPPTSRVFATAVQVRAGAEWQDAQSRIASGECKIELDKQMRDDDGIAIFTAARLTCRQTVWPTRSRASRHPGKACRKSGPATASSQRCCVR